MQLLFEATPTSMNSTPGAIEQEPAEWAHPTATDQSASASADARLCRRLRQFSLAVDT